MKKVKFIYNPISGAASNPKILDDVISIYQKYKKTIIPCRIDKNFTFDEAFQDFDNKYEHILIAGGDGTVNRFLNFYIKKGFTIPIAILPTGTANDFAKCLNIPLNIKDACEKILKSEPKYIDVGKVNDKYFINIFSFGLLTNVSQVTPTALKNKFGKIAYYFVGLKEFFKFKKFDLSIKTESFSKTIKCILVFIFNGKTAGNINIAYKSQIDDGFFDVIIVRDISVLSFFKLLLNLLLRKHLEEINEKKIIYFKSSSLSLSINKNILSDIDGEAAPRFPVNVECLYKKIKILF